MANGRRVSGTPGTGFIPLEEWGRANAGAYDALSQRLASGVDAQGQAAQQGLDSLYADFNRDVTAGGLTYKEPVARGLDAAGAAALGARTYTGPDSLAAMGNYDSVMGAADRAGQGARRLTDVYGRATALQDLARGTDYSAGQSLLDSALAGRAGGSRFAQLGQQWGGLLGRAQGLETTASQTAQRARQSTDAAASRYRDMAPILARQQEARDTASNDAYARETERQQDENERRGGVAGSEGRGKRPGRNYGTLDDWGRGGSWG